MELNSLGAGAVSRLAVVDLRQRIEAIAVNAEARLRGVPDQQFPRNDIRKRLTFIVAAYQDHRTIEELLGMVRLCRHIYKRSSDVLHGRSNLVNLSPVLLAEWEEAISHVESVNGSGYTA